MHIVPEDCDTLLLCYTVLNLLGVVKNGVGGCSGGDVTGDGGHHRLVHLRSVISTEKEHDVGADEL